MGKRTCSTCGGDMELNPGPRQNVANVTSEATQGCDYNNQSTSSENSVDSRFKISHAVGLSEKGLAE